MNRLAPDTPHTTVRFSSERKQRRVPQPRPQRASRARRSRYCSAFHNPYRKDGTLKQHYRIDYSDVVPNAYLTVRETQCLKTLLAMDHPTYAEVAQRLQLSCRTVEAHATHIRERFRCERKSALIALFQSIPLREITADE